LPTKADAGPDDEDVDPADPPPSPPRRPPVAAGDGSSRWVKRYIALRRGVFSGLPGRQAVLSACWSFRSFRFLTSRSERMRTWKDGPVRMSCTSSAVTERPSRTRVWTDERRLLRFRFEKMPRRGPE
jgi:hypothetical protein